MFHIENIRMNNFDVTNEGYLEPIDRKSIYMEYIPHLLDLDNIPIDDFFCAGKKEQVLLLLASYRILDFNAISLIMASSSEALIYKILMNLRREELIEERRIQQPLPSRYKKIYFITRKGEEYLNEYFALEEDEKFSGTKWKKLSTMQHDVNCINNSISFGADMIYRYIIGENMLLESQLEFESKKASKSNAFYYISDAQLTLSYQTHPHQKIYNEKYYFEQHMGTQRKSVLFEKISQYASNIGDVSSDVIFFVYGENKVPANLFSRVSENSSWYQLLFSIKYITTFQEEYAATSYQTEYDYLVALQQELDQLRANATTSMSDRKKRKELERKIKTLEYIYSSVCDYYKKIIEERSRISLELSSDYFIEDNFKVENDKNENEQNFISYYLKILKGSLNNNFLLSALKEKVTQEQCEKIVYPIVKEYYEERFSYAQKIMRKEVIESLFSNLNIYFVPEHYTKRLAMHISERNMSIKDNQNYSGIFFSIVNSFLNKFNGDERIKRTHLEVTSSMELYTTFSLIKENSPLPLFEYIPEERELHIVDAAYNLSGLLRASALLYLLKSNPAMMQNRTYCIIVSSDNDVSFIEETANFKSEKLDDIWERSIIYVRLDGVYM